MAFLSRHPNLRGRRVFLFLGRLEAQQKGLDLLLQGSAQAWPNDAALVLAGPDWRGGRRRVERLIARMEPERRPVLLGAVHGDAKRECFAAADVFVHTSRWEGMPNAVLEAAAAGLPCLLTAVADPLGRFGAERGAVVVEPDADAIAAGLRNMAELSSNDLRQMGERARQVTASELTWERCARILIDAYQRHCSQQG